MCKDVKLLVQTVLKMEKAMDELHTKVEDVSKEVNQLLQILNCRSRMQMLPPPLSFTTAVFTADCNLHRHKLIPRQHTHKSDTTIICMCTCTP